MLVENEMYNQAITDYHDKILAEMSKIWAKYIADKDNVPKPSFSSAVALVEIIGEGLKK